MTRIATLTLFAALLCISTTSLAQQVQVREIERQDFSETQYYITLETDDAQSELSVFTVKPRSLEPRREKMLREYYPEEWKDANSNGKQIVAVQKIKLGLECSTWLLFKKYESGEITIRYISVVDDREVSDEDYEKLIGYLVTLHFIGKSGKSLFFGKVFHPGDHRNNNDELNNSFFYYPETSPRKFDSVFKDIPLEELSAKNFSVECQLIQKDITKEETAKKFVMKDAEYRIDGFELE